MNYPIQIHPDISTIDFADPKLSAIFIGEGRGYEEVTTMIIDKIIKGELVITELHETPLGNVIYLSAVSTLN